MPKRQLSAKDILTDINAGMDDAALMEKYGLSAQGLQSAFAKLVAAGVLKQTELDERSPSPESTADLGWKCPACGKRQPKEFEECPLCGVIVRKYNSDAAPTRGSDNAGVMSGRTKGLWVVAFLLLLGLVWAGWHYRTKVAEESRIEAARLQQLERIEEQKSLQAEANERAKEYALQQEEIHRQSEAERLENEWQRQQEKDTEAWRSQEAAQVQKEQGKQQEQKSQRAAKEKHARLRVTWAYLKMLRLTRDMSISLLGGDVLSALPVLKARFGEFLDRLSELKVTPGTDPEVVDHYGRASLYLIAAFRSRSRKKIYGSVRMWREECKRAREQMKVSHR